MVSNKSRLLRLYRYLYMNTDDKHYTTKAEIMEKCPDISAATVQRTLSDLLKRGEIIKISGGRYTSYTWNRENES